jgi:hypothetical protein
MLERVIGDRGVFFYVGPPKESIFLTTFYGLYFSHELHMLQITILYHDIDHLWAAFVYCINTCLSDLWVLIFICWLYFCLCDLESQVVHFF